jgi:hypothetical protein
VQIDVAGSTGFLIACPAMTSAATAIIAGFSLEEGHNLTTSGVPKQMGTAPSPPQNQPNAVIIFGGAWPSDGQLGFATAEDINEFIGMLGDSNDNTTAVLAQAMLGAVYGLTQDATTKYWYVDHHITSAAAGSCVQVTELVDAIGTLNGRVRFRVLKACQQLAGLPSA